MRHEFIRELPDGSEQSVAIHHYIDSELNYDGSTTVTTEIIRTYVDGRAAEITDAEAERWSRELEDMHRMPSFEAQS